MNFITHACLPVVLVSAAEIILNKQNKVDYLSNWQLVLIGVAGMLPDLLWPHFSLRQRMHSPTHTIWFLSVVFPIVFLLAKWKLKEGYVRFSLLFWMAVALHIAADAISGGVNLLYPISAKIGMYLIPYRLWVRSDIIFVGLTIILWTSVERRKRRFLTYS